MSITFQLHPLPEPTGWALQCDVYDADEVTVASFDDAGLYDITHTAGCGDCRNQGGMLIRPLRDPEGLNVNQGGGALLLETLGFTRDDIDSGSGIADAEDFLGRCLTALAIAPVDEGVPAAAHPRNPRWTDGGRPAGYVHDRLQQLVELVEVARARGCQISWA